MRLDKFLEESNQGLKILLYMLMRLLKWANKKKRLQRKKLNFCFFWVSIPPKTSVQELIPLVLVLMM